MSKQKIFNQLLTFMNLYQHKKNLAISSFFSGAIADFNTSKEQDFFKYGICAGT